MKIVTNNLNNQDIQTTGTVKNMRFGENADAMLFDMFTSKIYSDPIGTVIREITSNCFDSHVEAGVDSAKNPVIVEFGNDVAGHYISFTDKGVGMSPDRVQNIYCEYFNSTKRTTNDLIGGFGIGGKTPLAYGTKTFYIITRYDGVEYVYSVFNGQKAPALELMSQTSTDKPNGTTIKVPVLTQHIDEFERKTLRQLYYFENIVFKGFSNRYVTNDYKIIKGKKFLYRGSTYSDYMHVCYGKVAYPLDYDALGLNKNDYQIPVAVKIEIGELHGTGVTTSRESLQYDNDENIKIIKRKMNEVIDELKSMLDDQYDNVRTLSDYYTTMGSNFGWLNFDDNNKIYLGKNVSKSDITLPNFKYNGLRIPEKSSILGDFYNIKLYGKNLSKRSWRRNEWRQTLETINQYDNIYYVNGEFNRNVKRQGYLRTISKTDNFFVLTPIELKNKELDSLLLKYGAKLKKVDSFGNDTYDFVIEEKKAIKLINEMYKEVHALVTKYSTDYDSVYVPQSYLDSIKKDRLSKEVLNSTIPVKFFYDSWSGTRDRIKLEELVKLDGKIFYGFQDDDHLLRKASRIFSSLSKYNAVSSAYRLKHDKRGYVFIKISQANEKFMKLLGNKAKHVKYFDNMFLYKKLDKIANDIALSNLKDRFTSNILEIFESDIMKHVNIDVYNKVKELRKIFMNCNSGIINVVDSSYIKNRFGIDIMTLVDKSNVKKDVDQIIDLNVKNKNRLKWFELPYTFNIENEDHKELVGMLQLVFEK